MGENKTIRRCNIAVVLLSEYLNNMLIVTKSEALVWFVLTTTNNVRVRQEDIVPKFCKTEHVGCLIGGRNLVSFLEVNLVSQLSSELLFVFIFVLPSFVLFV